MSLEKHWNEYKGSCSEWNPFWGKLTGGGYFCPFCNIWVTFGNPHVCGSNPSFCYSYYPERNKTEEAYKILKILVEKKIISEPDSFKKFCELIEEIAKVI